MSIKKLLTISIISSVFIIPIHAQTNPPQLSQPLGCTLGEDCFIQNYVDADAGDNYHDYHCGYLSYDAHKGTDFRPKADNALTLGIPVFAAADGVVRATRDGMDDISVRQLGKAAIKGREAGNSVVIVHNPDWESQYAHLKKGSIAVHAGQTVTRGALLGLVGLSGNSEFVHLHFEIRYQGKAIDPFIGIAGGDNCNVGKQPLWTAQTLSQLSYKPTALLGAGFSNHPLANDELISEQLRLSTDAPAIVFWATLLGVQAGDEQRIELTAADGSALLQQSSLINRNMAQYRSFWGLKRKTQAWTRGDYRVNFKLLRQQQVVLDKDFILTID